MAKPPPSTPHTDITGPDRDRVTPADPRKVSGQAQAQMAVENKENVGRPDQDHGSPAPDRHGPGRNTNQESTHE